MVDTFHLIVYCSQVSHLHSKAAPLRYGVFGFIHLQAFSNRWSSARTRSDSLSSHSPLLSCLSQCGCFSPHCVVFFFVFVAAPPAPHLPPSSSFLLPLHYLQGFIHPRRCRISSINSMASNSGDYTPYISIHLGNL